MCPFKEIQLVSVVMKRVCKMRDSRKGLGDQQGWPSVAPGRATVSCELISSVEVPTQRHRNLG